MKDKKILSIVLVFVVLFAGMLFAACGDTKKSASIEFISMWNSGEPEVQFLKEMMASFEQETGTSFTVSWSGRDNLTKLRTRFLSGDVPDLIEQCFSEFGGLLQGEILLQPIDDLYNTKGPEGQARVEDLFDKNALDLYKINGQHYLFPFTVSTSGFFYDKTIFKQYGLEVPTTWEEFMSNAEVMKANNFPPLALDATIAFYNAYYFYWIVQRILGDGAMLKAAADKTGNTFLENPGYLEAAKLVSSLSIAQDNLFQPGYSGSGWPAAQSDWALNKSGSIYMGSWIVSETVDIRSENFEMGYYPFPLIKNGKGRLKDMTILPCGYAIPKGAKNAAAVKDFLIYINKKEHQEKLVAITDSFSPRTDIAYPEELKDIQQYMQGASYHLVHDGVQQTYPEWQNTIFFPLDDALISGKIDAEEFIQSLAKNSATYWKNKQ